MDQEESMAVIYMATNLDTGKAYVGQTWNFERRKYFHHYGKGGAMYFSRSMLEHGKDRFAWSILLDGIEDQKTLDIAEDWAIWFHRTLFPNGYNLREGGNGGGSLSPESKAKQKASTTRANKALHADPEWRKMWRTRYDAGLARRAVNQEWRDNARKAMDELSKNEHWIAANKATGKRNAANPEWIKKVIAGGRKFAKPVLCVETEVIYPSIRNAFRVTGIDASMIMRVCKGRQRTAGGFHWKYKEDQ
jgi:group I intron endonuclease